MAWFPCKSGTGMPSGLQTQMDAVLNKKFGTSTTYPATDWPDTVNLMGVLPVRTATKAPICSFSDGADGVPCPSVLCEISPLQASGTPSPSNPLPISGFTGLTLTNKDDISNPTHTNTYSVNWQSEAGTVYGGTLDVVSGVLAVTWGYIASYNGETLTGRWMSSMDTYVAGTTPTTGAEVVYELATPVTYQLTPQEVTTLLATNNFFHDANGDSQVTYRSTNAVVDSKTITANGTYNASADNLDGYSSVSVNVAPNVGTKSITQNGTYNASSESLDGYSEVTVNVSGGGTTIALHEGKISKNDGSISANSNYWYSDEFDAASGAVMFDFGEVDADNNIIAWYVNGSFVDYWSSSQRYRLVDATSYYQSGMKYRLCFKKSVLEDVLYKDYVADKTISFDNSVIVVPSIELHEGAIDTDGTIVANSDYYYTDFIDMSQNQEWIMFDVGTGSGGSYEGLRIYYSDGTLQDYWSANTRFRLLDFSNVWQSGMKMRLSFKKQYTERAVIIDYTGNIAYYCGDIKKLEE